MITECCIPEIAARQHVRQHGEGNIVGVVYLTRRELVSTVLYFILITSIDIVRAVSKSKWGPLEEPP